MERPRLIGPRALLCLLAILAAGCPRSTPKPTRPDARRPAAKRPPPDIPEQGPLAQRILYDQGKSLLRAGKPERAAEMFRRAIAAGGKEEGLANCYLGLGSALSELGRRDEAVEAYRKVAALRPSDPEAHRALAMGEEEAGKLEDAKRSLERSLELDPSQVSAYQDLAAIYLRAKDLEGAKKVYLRYELKRTELIKTLGLSREEDARVAAASALGEARDEATARALGLGLSDRSRAVRLAVIRALGQQGLAAGAGPLKDLLARSVDAEEKRAIEASLKAIAAAPQPSPASQPAPGAPEKKGVSPP
jgi:Flp pilus assembly protein TadD